MSARASKPAYKRISGLAGGVATHASLWLGDAHFMQVRASIGQERYQRFFLKDIQAFLVRPSKVCRVWLVVCALLALPGVAMLAWVMSGPGDPTGWMIYCCAILVLAVGGMLGARTRRVYVVTAVQTTQLHPLSRPRKFDKFIARVRPLIEEAQAGLNTPPPMPSPASEPTAPTA